MYMVEATGARVYNGCPDSRQVPKSGPRARLSKIIKIQSRTVSGLGSQTRLEQRGAIILPYIHELKIFFWCKKVRIHGIWLYAMVQSSATLTALLYALNCGRKFVGCRHYISYYYSLEESLYARRESGF